MQNKRFWSESYQRFLEFRVTTSVIKEVKRFKNGIDDYLRYTPSDILLYPKAVQMKRNLKKKDRIAERNAALAALELQSSGAVSAGATEADA